MPSVRLSYSPKLSPLPSPRLILLPHATPAIAPVRDVELPSVTLSAAAEALADAEALAFPDPEAGKLIPLSHLCPLMKRVTKLIVLQKLKPTPSATVTEEIAIGSSALRKPLLTLWLRNHRSFSSATLERYPTITAAVTRVWDVQLASVASTTLA